MTYDRLFVPLSAFSLVGPADPGSRLPGRPAALVIMRRSRHLNTHREISVFHATSSRTRFLNTFLNVFKSLEPAPSLGFQAAILTQTGLALTQTGLA